jgi:hypothetical protein
VFESADGSNYVVSDNTGREYCLHITEAPFTVTWIVMVRAVLLLYDLRAHSRSLSDADGRARLLVGSRQACARRSTDRSAPVQWRHSRS